MDILHSVVLAVIEGLTEFLPISSTGHMILASDLLNIPESYFLKSFEIIVQLGAILAIVILYIKMLLSNTNIWMKLITAFLPTAIVGWILYGFIKTHLLSNTVVVLWSLFLGGVFLIVWEKYFHVQKNIGIEIEDLSYKKGFSHRNFSVIVCRTRCIASGGDNCRRDDLRASQARGC